MSEVGVLCEAGLLGLNTVQDIGTKTDLLKVTTGRYPADPGFLTSCSAIFPAHSHRSGTKI